MKKGTGNTVYASLGANGNSRAEHDYYATEPKATKLLLEQETFQNQIWEPACGGGSISEVLKSKGYSVYSSDLIDRGYGSVQDFLSSEHMPYDDCDIITNPPYSLAEQFVRHSIELANPGAKIAMFLKIQFLEGISRRELFKIYPPRTVYVSSGRLRCVKNGEFDLWKDQSAICYAWYIWQKGYTGDTILKWIN